ncbi:diguanylate cyclase [Vulgatibacter sp.]|uniref:diguanylate cyclase n=1 Tax=Vulgatibacter sp. TaxID=1971226 RepID=UPI00356A3B95
MPRILVVDDTRSAQEELVRLLAGAGHQTDAVGDGLAAVKAARSEPFDLVVLDLVLPGLDGLQVLRMIKQHASEDDHLPVLLTSVRGDVASRVEGLRLGADDFLARPFDGQELLARVDGLLRIKAMHDRIAGAKRELERLSSTDSLTGLYNHRFLERRLREEFLRAQRYRNELALAVIDLDHFKQVNDGYGHLAGDEVLREFAQLLREEVRETDFIARYGGEEFVMLLPETALDGAAAVLRRVQEEMAGRRFGAPYASLQVTCSAGIALFPGAGIQSPEELLRCADNALYEAKRTGRNRFCCYGMAS